MRWTLFQEPGQFTDALFPTRFGAAGCKRLLMICADEQGVVALTKLWEAGVPMVSIGHGPPAFGLLQIPVVEGDDEEAMRRLVLQLRREGCRRLLVVGFDDPLLGMDRVRGCVSAFEQFAHEYPTDTKAVGGTCAGPGDHLSESRRLSDRLGSGGGVAGETPDGSHGGGDQ